MLRGCAVLVLWLVFMFVVMLKQCGRPVREGWCRCTRNRRCVLVVRVGLWFERDRTFMFVWTVPVRGNQCFRRWKRPFFHWCHGLLAVYMVVMKVLSAC